MANICVLGGGGWAIGIAVLLSNNGHDVTMWSALESEVNDLSTFRENKRALPGVKISGDVFVTGDLGLAVKDKDIIIMAVASSFVRKTSAAIKKFVRDGQIILSVAKGIEDGTLKLMSQVIADELCGCDVAVLSGPTHAEEVGIGLPTTAVVGAESSGTAKYIQSVFSSSVFRTYTSDDIKGIELGGALKNVIALAAGIADGLGYGDNTKAALITRGIHEISRLGVRMGCDPETFVGLSGIGDLIVTCASMHSRNRRAGILIGRGKTLEEAKREVGTVVEGAVCAGAALKLSEKYDVELPITEQVNLILFKGKNAADAVGELMGRRHRAETDKGEKTENG